MLLLLLDYVTDTLLAYDYLSRSGWIDYNESNDNITRSGRLIGQNSSTSTCPDLSYDQGDYQTAFVATMVGLVLPYLVIGPTLCGHLGFLKWFRVSDLGYLHSTYSVLY